MLRTSVPFLSLVLLSALTAPSFAQDADAEAAYIHSGCWGCHGYVGQGGRDGPRIAHTQLTYEAFSAFVRNTAGDMPPFTARSVPEEDLGQVYTYLQSIPEPPAPDTIPLLQNVFPDD
jgi:mono/diheme cytochrome c family protein